MSQSVWTIESGEYSDYRVHAVYSTKELAVEILEAAGIEWTDDPEWGYNTRIVERPLDPEPDLAQRGYDLWWINMKPDGTVDQCNPSTLDLYNLFDRDGLYVSSGSSSHVIGNVASHVIGYVVARSREHAIKIANEFRAQAIADGRIK